MIADVAAVDSVGEQPGTASEGVPAIQTLSFSYKPQEYATIKKVLIPINPCECNGGRFSSLDDALDFVLQHCLKYYNTTRRNIVHKYSEQIGVIDTVRGAYIPVSSIPAKEFNRVYNRSTKRIINKPLK